MSKAQLITNNLKYTFNNRLLFEDINLSVFPKDRVALVGKNGSGKSTLLKIISKNLEAIGGTVTSNQSIGYFAQSYPEVRNLDLTIAEYLIQKDIQLDQVYTTYLRIWLQQLDFLKTIKTLSGGEFTKFMFAIMADKNPDLLILDEPTNNLDDNSILRLKEYIQYFQGGVVFVSHNRSFLNEMANRLWILDSQKILLWNTTLSEFESAQNAQKEKILRIYSNQQKEIEKLKSHISRKLSETRTMDIKFKSTNPYMRKKAGKKAKTAQILQSKVLKKISSLEESLPQNSKKAYLELNEVIPQSNLLLALKNYNAFNKNVDLNIYYGDRIVIEGTNGSGKTTLCKKIYQETKDKFKVAYLDQKYEIVDLSKSVLENMEFFNPGLGHESLRRFLGNFLFSNKDQISQKASTLSGGELARLAFAMVTAGEIELLILDEPVNNIDNQTLEVIIQGINSFKGAMVVVSHDTNFKLKLETNNSINL